MSGPVSHDVRMGIYRHYKGSLYLVLGLAHDANEVVPGPREHDWTGLDAQGQDVDGDRCCIHCGQDPRTWCGEWCEYVPRAVVVYVPLQLDGAHLGLQMAVRTLNEWDDFICANPTHQAYGQVGSTGSCLVERFTYLGPELTQEMLPDTAGGSGD